MVVYHGDIQAEAIFDPAMLSAVFTQVKFKNQADTTAEQAIRPIGLPRNLSRPLPYLALLLELGNESAHRTAHSKIKVTIPKHTAKDEFQNLTEDWLAAAKTLNKVPRGRRKGPGFIEKQKVVKEKRLAMDAYNRYSIAVRGASPDVYGILRKAKVERAFSTLLSITMPSPTVQDTTIQHMQPLERLGRESGHTVWMSKYVGKGEEDFMDVDDI
jgi:hypothetical protein